MREEQRSGMSSTVRRLGHEISKLGLRMRNKTPSNSDSDICCSTDEIAAKGSHECVSQTSVFEEGFDSFGAAGTPEMKTLRQRRHSRNELDEDVECKERNNSIKTAIRPILTRKSRSDLAKYSSRRNGHELSIKQDTRHCNSSENIGDEVQHDARNGKTKVMETERGTTYRVAPNIRAGEHVRKTKSGQKPKRSKSFSGLLNWRHGNKQVQRDKTVKSPECPRRYLKRSNSFSGKVEPKQEELEATERALYKQTYTLPCAKETHRNNNSRMRPEIFVALKSNEAGSSSGFTDGMLTCSEHEGKPRLSFMAYKGFRYDEGMIETDLCSTEL